MVMSVEMTDGNTGRISGSSMSGLRTVTERGLITGDLRESNRKSGNGAENGREPLDFGISDID